MTRADGVEQAEAFHAVVPDPFGERGQDHRTVHPKGIGGERSAWNVCSELANTASETIQ